MDKIRELLKGKKTYLVTLAATLAAVIAWASGELETAELVEAVVAAVLAATLRAGVQKSGPTTPATLLPFLLPLVLMGGCVGMSNGQKYILASQTYAATANTVAALVRAGEFGTADKAKIRAVNDTCLVLIMKMRDDMLQDNTPFDFEYTLRQFQTVLDELLRLQLKAEAAKTKKEKASGPDNANTGRTDGGDPDGGVARQGDRGVSADGASADPSGDRCGYAVSDGGTRQPGQRTGWLDALADWRIGQPIPPTSIEVEYD